MEGNKTSNKKFTGHAPPTMGDVWIPESVIRIVQRVGYRGIVAAAVTRIDRSVHPLGMSTHGSAPHPPDTIRCQVLVS